MKHYDYTVFINIGSRTENVHVNLPVPISEYHGYTQHYSVLDNFYNAELPSKCVYQEVFHYVVSKQVISLFDGDFVEYVCKLSEAKYDQIYKYINRFRKNIEKVKKYYYNCSIFYTYPFIIIQNYKATRRHLCLIKFIGKLPNCNEYCLRVQQLTKI